MFGSNIFSSSGQPRILPPPGQQLIYPPHLGIPQPQLPWVPQPGAAGFGSHSFAEIKLTENVPGVGMKGQVVKLTLYPSEVNAGTSLILDTLIVGFKQPGFRGQEACPEFLVDVDTGSYQVYGLSNTFRAVNVLSSIQAAIPEVDADRSLATYYLLERALGGFVPAVTQWNADNTPGSLDPKAAVSKRIKAALDLDYELRVWALLTNLSNWNANNRATLGAGSEWTNVNGTPITDLNARLNASAQQVTDIWFNPLVCQAFLAHAQVKDYIKYIKGDTPTPSEIVQAQQNQTNLDFTIAGYPPFRVVASKVLNETTGALDYIMPDTTVLTSNPAGAGSSGDEIMSCKTFRRRGPSGTGYQVIERPIQQGERGFHGGTFLAAGNADQVQMISGVVGGAIANCLA